MSNYLGYSMLKASNNKMIIKFIKVSFIMQNMYNKIITIMKKQLILKMLNILILFKFSLMISLNSIVALTFFK